jgi:haloalkane dehalogenase
VSQANKKIAIVNGRKMAYVETGEGDPIVFQHGNPTSSYLWRNVMPHLAGRGRLIACDLIGMGDSEKLDPSGPDQYTYLEHRNYLFGLWDQLRLDRNVVLVLHDWGSALGFDWAAQHPERVAGIVYTEAVVMPFFWSDWPDKARGAFQGFRSPAGEQMILEKNMFVERVLATAVLRPLADADMAVYRAPYAEPGESRRPTLTWPRQIPIEGEPAHMVDIVDAYGQWLAHSPVPKLFVNAEPGSILTGRHREFCRSWPNQTEVTVPGGHYVPEDSPDALGAAIAAFVERLSRGGPRKNNVA